MIDKENEEPIVSTQLAMPIPHLACKTYVLSEGAVYISKDRILITCFCKEFAPDRRFVVLRPLFTCCNIYQVPFPAIRVLDLLQTYSPGFVKQDYKFPAREEVQGDGFSV